MLGGMALKWRWKGPPVKAAGKATEKPNLVMAPTSRWWGEVRPLLGRSSPATYL